MIRLLLLLLAAAAALAQPSPIIRSVTSTDIVSSAKIWLTNGVSYTTASGSNPGTCTIGAWLLRTDTNIWYYCASANTWQQSTNAAGENFTLGPSLFGGHMAIGNEARVDRDIDECTLCLRDTQTQTTDHSIGLSNTKIWAPASNPNSRSLALFDGLYFAGGSGVTIPFTTGFSDNAGILAGTIQESRGFTAATPTVIGGTITNRYGLHFSNQCTAGVTNCYAMATEGGAHVFGDYLNINGRQDIRQLLVKGNATQTSPLVDFQTSAGTSIFALSNAGVLTNATWQGAPVAPAYQQTKMATVVHSLETFTTQTDIPSAVTEYPSSAIWRTVYDFSNVTNVRMVCFVAVAGNSGSVLKAQYSTNSGGAWNDLGASCSLTSTGLIDSGFGAIAGGAKGNVWVRFATAGGNATADPGLTTVSLQAN